MWIELLFSFMFSVQIVLISYYYPKKIKSKMAYIFEHYPHSTHAKLYPKGYETALKGKIVFGLINGAILLLGLGIMVVISMVLFTGDKTLDQFNMVPMMYGLVQAIPFFILELSAFKQFKLMRNLNTDSKRSAELNPRGLFSFISPMQLFAAVAMFIICSYLILSFNNFVFDFDIAILFGSMVLANLLFIVLGYILVRGKRLDPHQSAKDRHTATQAALRSYISVSILISIFFIFNRSVDTYLLELWEPIFNTLYWLLVVLLSTGTMLKHVDLHDINFDVYKTSNPVK
ncbi:hypothetical protein [Paraglaciecola sp. L3A3]|uniref:hypothetical protein n=1 Tax=Paraglaciecola sp. L3A3 TaxID=2686358 RepID=UPI00131EBA29|nr:hypothetical protein [Paraglaciecola sp. L3A3]